MKGVCSRGVVDLERKPGIYHHERIAATCRMVIEGRKKGKKDDLEVPRLDYWGK